MCKDRAGTGLLHKAVFRGQRGVVDWLLDNQPNTVHLKDREGRTPLHYCGACEDQDAMWQRLVDAGADVGAKDNRGRTADYYLEKPDELRLPTSPQHPAESRGRAADTGLVVKPANIRIWIHDRDMGKLQQLLWEGHGARLRNETSKYPIVKRFLEGVPFVMGAVKDVHTAAIAGDLETFQKRTEEPVPREIFTSKDANGLTPLHKAAGLGHGHIVDDILARAPGAVSVCDAERRTALHFAALVRDGGEVYNKLVRAGADELAQDNMGRTPEHYKSKPADLDAGLLRVVPDAPRTSAAYPPNWDWSVITDPAARVFNGRRSYENGDSESASSRDNEDVVAPTQRAGEDGQGAVGEGGDGDGDSEASPQPAGDASGGQEGASLRDGDADAAENDESAEGGDPPGPPQNDVDGDVGEEESSEQPEQGDADDEVGADEVAPTDSVPTEGAPSGAAPSGDAPAEDASNEEAPPEGAPDQNAATEVSANEIPVADASTGDIPDDEARTEEASTVEASTPAEVSEDRCTTEDGDGQDAEAEDGGVEVGGAEDGEVEDGEVEDGDAGASNAEGGDAQGSDAEGGDAEGGDVEGGDAGGGDAEGGDAEGGDAEGGDAGGDAGGSGGEDGIGNEDGVGDGGVQEVSGGGDSVKGDGIEQDGIEQDGIEQDGTEAGADEEGRIEGDGVEGEVSEENKEAEEMDDDQKDVISKPEQKSQTEDGDGAKEEEEEKTEEGEDRDAKLQKDDEKDRDNDDADQGGANANEGTGLDEEGERQADNEEGGGDAQPDGENSEDKGEGRGQEEVNEELTQADSGQEQVEDAVGQDAPAERDSGDGVDSREQESADAPEASGEEEGEDVVVGDTSDAQGGARDRDSTSTKEKEQRELAPAPSAQEIQTMSLLAPGVRTRRQRLARIVKAITLQKYMAQRAAARRAEGAYAARVAAEASANVQALGKARGRCLWRLASVVVLRTLRWAKKGFPLYDRDWDDPQEEVEDDEAELVEDAEQLLTYTFYPAYSNWRGDRARYMWALLREEASNLHPQVHSFDSGDERDDIPALRWVKLRLMLPEVLELGRRGREGELGDDGGTSARASAGEDSGTNQSAATTVALDGTDLEPEPPPPPEPEPEPVPRDKAEEGRGDVRARPPTPRPQATLLGNDGGDEDEDEEDEGVGEDDDERYPRDPGQMTDDELDAHISRGDLGVLADLVLNGEGDRLLNKNSSNPEVQSFLDHVPSYMAKIRAVHDAARAGNLRGLQAALDRRKFAVARDRRSQSACTPLHLAVLLGQTAVVRYLSGRFPETLSARDLRGRTALHYAAVLADNAHYYNLLLNLGANRALKDKRGATADFYLQNPNTLTHRQLLADIGEPESIADEMFSDKDPLTKAAPKLGTLFGSEDGRYLATALGEPLLQGLNEIADKKPRDPVGYLANFLYNFTGTEVAPEAPGEAQVMAAVLTNGLAEPVGNEDFADNQRPDSQASDAGPKPSAFKDGNRDEFGQSPLHFASARPHGRGGLLQFMSEADLNPALRDELYRTARDVAMQAGLPDNVEEIDRWVLSVAARGQTDKLAEMLLTGYDHILNARESPEVGIVDVAQQRGHTETVAFLQSITAFEERRDRLLRAIRMGGAQGAQEVAEILEPADSRAKLLATARNNMGRCALHVAVLCQQEQLVAYLAHNFADTLHVGDNLERTALHYAMGVEAVESLSKLLIKAGAWRVPKDLKGRQPSYYFMNKTDIQHLQEEEEAQMV
ncbi:uncharacterized protein LOC113205649 isoform X2 [Frankliniella occidentalis]|uniref:Uncharacterized protein LOC113205649 isoform X2 n=1 Tax=Frankliniella occidentalis TaxID=133901 RepID=A0A9C6TPH0_FRAOC|nr:uncharacterized protein LOC113205649 isoform X2 [Frankliniella occidentalis]